MARFTYMSYGCLVEAASVGLNFQLRYLPIGFVKISVCLDEMNHTWNRQWKGNYNNCERFVSFSTVQWTQTFTELCKYINTHTCLVDKCSWIQRVYSCQLYTAYNKWRLKKQTLKFERLLVLEQHFRNDKLCLAIWYPHLVYTPIKKSCFSHATWSWM